MLHKGRLHSKSLISDIQWSVGNVCDFALKFMWLTLEMRHPNPK